MSDFTQAAFLCERFHTSRGFFCSIDDFVMAITSAEAVIPHALFTTPGIPPGPNPREMDHDGYDHNRPVRGCSRTSWINRGANKPRDRRRANRSVNCTMGPSPLAPHRPIDLKSPGVANPRGLFCRRTVARWAPFFLHPLSDRGAPGCSHHISGFLYLEKADRWGRAARAIRDGTTPVPPPSAGSVAAP